MARHDSNIDPFNAGEPTLPWDGSTEESTPATESGYEAPDDHYDSPVKTEDDYQAPETEEGASKPAESKPGSTPTPKSKWAEDNAGSRRRSRDAENPAPTAAPKRRFPRWLIVVIILVLFNAGGGMLDGIGSLFDSATDAVDKTFDFQLSDAPSNDSDDAAADAGSEDSGSPSSNGDEQQGPKISVEQARSLAESALKELPNDADIKAQMAQKLDETIQSGLRYTSQELGVDTSAYAGWLFSNATYTFTHGYVFDTNDPPTAPLYFSATAPKKIEVFNQAIYNTRDYFVSQKIAYWNQDKPLPTLTDEQKAHVQQLFAAPQAPYPTDTYDSFRVELVYRDGSWTVDKEKLMQSVRSLFLL